MSYIPVAVEMYSVRKEFSDNPLKTMQALKTMGYEGVEFAGAPQYSNDFYAALLKETGLVCCGWHTPWNLFQGDALEETVQRNLAVGNKYLIVPWFQAPTLEGWKEFGRQVNDVAAKLAKYGMRIGYHNHAHDFAPLDGVRTWDTFFSVTDPRVLIQVDTGNAVAGGADIMAELNGKCAGRAKTIHLKPYSQARQFEPMIGEDECPWKEIFAFCQTQGDTEWYVIEYECEVYPALEAVEKCLKAVRAMQA